MSSLIRVPPLLLLLGRRPLIAAALLHLLARAVVSRLVLAYALLAQDVVLGESLRRQDRILTQLVVQRREMVYLVQVCVAVEHAQRVVRVAALASSVGQLLPIAAHVILKGDFLQAIVGKIVVGLLLRMLSLALNQVFNLSLGEFRRGMGPVWLPHLLPGAHIEQAFAQLLLDFVGRKVHILAVLHKLVKRLLLRYEGLGGLGRRPGA